ncbi:MFS transporter [Bdellovibrio bacteriovorus]|uniref:MFS transporter n=1 Tax=Bdellovibrio bacteriovorus TaxID=959 RepID=UPI003A8136B4
MHDESSNQNLKRNAKWGIPFWTFFAGQALSQVGSAVTQFIIMWWLTVETASVTVLSTAGLFALLPQALLSPLGGVFADRYSRKFILIFTDTISALCVVLLMVTLSYGKPELWVVYLMLFVRSSMQAFQGPASQASVENLVPTSFISTAAGLNQSILGLVSIASAPIGAVVLGMFPIHHSLWVDVITALMSVISLLFITIPQPKRLDQGDSHLWRDFKEGFMAVYSVIAYRRLFSVLAAVTVLVMPCFTLFTLLVTQHFNGGEKMAGTFGALSGLGMLLGGLAVAFAKPEKKVKTLLVAWIISCLTITATAAPSSNMVWVALGAWFVSGFAFTFGNAPLTALLQLKIPNQFQGRVFSLLNVLMGLSAPIGLALVAPIGEVIGIRFIMIILSLLAAAACMAGFASSSLKSLDQK